jgi:hypothetical protein
MGERILADLRRVEQGRRACSADPELGQRVRDVKAYQHRRFQGTYADLLRDSRYRSAAQFFLDDLYGPHDFVERDAQFARVVPGMTRLFPHDVVVTVAALSELHALSEELDLAMGRSLPGDAPIDAASYRSAWQTVGRTADRLRQVALMRQVGDALDRFTKSMVLRHALHAMGGPARALGLGALQAFLERGFDTFRELHGAQPFLDTVSGRECRLIHRLFDTSLSASDLESSGELP